MEHIGITFLHRDGELGAIPDTNHYKTNVGRRPTKDDTGRHGTTRDDTGRHGTTRDDTGRHGTTKHDERRDARRTRNSHRLNLTSALIYTGRDHNLIGNWGREEELTIKRMEYT